MQKATQNTKKVVDNFAEVAGAYRSEVERVNSEEFRNSNPYARYMADRGYSAEEYEKTFIDSTLLNAYRVNEYAFEYDTMRKIDKDEQFSSLTWPEKRDVYSAMTNYMYDAADTKKINPNKYSDPTSDECNLVINYFKKNTKFSDDDAFINKQYDRLMSNAPDDVKKAIEKYNFFNATDPSIPDWDGTYGRYLDILDNLEASGKNKQAREERIQKESKTLEKQTNNTQELNTDNKLEG